MSEENVTQDKPWPPLPDTEVECKMCHYKGAISTFPPATSVYNDIVCPRCGSTYNDHNAEYQRRLQEGFRRSNEVKP